MKEKAKALFDKIKAADKRHLLGSLVFSAFIFLMLAAFWNTPIFPSDEAEIYMHGQSIANGKILYKEIASQHMPVMYYIAALFSLLGARTVLGFRIFFFVLTALIYGAIYFFYSKRVSRLGVILFPVIYILTLPGIDYGACILSDQYQGIGMAILFLEFICFIKTHELPIGSCVAISLAILISFGSAFVSIFAIFVMFVTVVAFDLSAVGKNRPECNKTAKAVLIKYGRLVGIVLIPLALIAFVILVTGSMKDFYFWAYRVNMDIYPKYNNYSSSVIQNIFFGFQRFFIYFDSLNYSALNATVILRIAIIFLTLVYLIKISVGRGFLIKLAGSAIFISACATRGLFDFHGTPAVAVFSLCAAMAVGEFLESHPLQKPATTAIAALVAIVVASPYCARVLPNLFKMDYNQCVMAFQGDISAKYIDAITEDGERIGFSTLDCHIPVLSKTIPASNQGGSVPWFWEAGREQAMQELTEDPPRVFLYYSEHVVWGYKMRDYAPELVEFIESNYSPLGRGTVTVWVLNSYYDEAAAIIDAMK